MYGGPKKRRRRMGIFVQKSRWGGNRCFAGEKGTKYRKNVDFYLEIERKADYNDKLCVNIKVQSLLR